MKIDKKAVWNTAGDSGALPPRDFFPLAPLLVIGMLWQSSFGFAELESLWPSMVAAGVVGLLGFGLYRWLCGAGHRAVGAGVAIFVVFAASAWRAWRAEGMEPWIFYGMLLMFWAALKFGGRHGVNYGDHNGAVRINEDDPNGYWGDLTDVTHYTATLTRKRREVLSSEMRVLSGFRPQFPAAWSAGRRLASILQLAAAGVTLAGLGIITYDGSGAGFMWFWFGPTELSWFLVLLGWCMVQFAYELRMNSRSQDGGISESAMGGASPPPAPGRKRPTLK